MKTDIALKTRREFLRSTVLGSALSWTVPTFLANTFSALQAAAVAAGGAIRQLRRRTLQSMLSPLTPNDVPCPPTDNASRSNRRAVERARFGDKSSGRSNKVRRTVTPLQAREIGKLA